MLNDIWIVQSIFSGMLTYMWTVGSIYSMLRYMNRTVHIFWYVDLYVVRTVHIFPVLGPYPVNWICKVVFPVIFAAFINFIEHLICLDQIREQLSRDCSRMCFKHLIAYTEQLRLEKYRMMTLTHTLVSTMNYLILYRLQVHISPEVLYTIFTEIKIKSFVYAEESRIKVQI